MFILKMKFSKNFLNEIYGMGIKKKIVGFLIFPIRRIPD